jgi:rSAM/selenodomain-associated transferase 1
VRALDGLDAVDPAGTIALAVIAKSPVPGRVKTRLSPPCSQQEAATLAEAALADTLAVVAETPAMRRVLVLDGRPGDWLPNGVEVLEQRGGGLAERLADAFDQVGEPAFLIGMDTPQVSPALLAAGQRAVARGAAALGPADDGGYWGIGLPAPYSRAFSGVPMSHALTGVAQRAALERLGLEVTTLPSLRDIDTITDAHAVAALAPRTRFAAAWAAVGCCVDGSPRT